MEYSITQTEDRQRLTLSARYAIHSPTHSGIRATAEMGSYVERLYEMPGPLVVFEDDGREFLGFTWSPWDPRISFTKPAIRQEGENWIADFPAGAAVRAYPAEKSLDAVVSHYRDEHPPVEVPGATVLKRIQRCVFLDMWLVDGRISHDFDDAIRLVEELDKRGLADGTLLYVCGWHAPYDTRMPAWTPAEQLGGKPKFGKLADLCRQTGAILMPHMNYWGYDRNSGLLENWQDAWSGSRWIGNIGICPGYPIEYMLVDDPRWIKLFDSYFDETVSEFRLEAVFLDQCGNAFKSAKGNMVTATRSMLERIHGKFPDLLLGAEVLSEHIVDHVPLIQATWLMEENIGKFSPITRLMFKDRIRFKPHLFLGASLPCKYVYTNMPLIVEYGFKQVFDWYLENNRDLGGIPSVRLDYKRSGIDPRSLEVLKSG